MDATEVTDAAKRIPPVGWAGIVGAGLVLGLYLRHRSASGPVTVGDAAASSTSLPTDGIGAGGTVLTPVASVGAALPVTQHATTNQEWLTMAETFLIARGVDAGVADQALREYLNGDDMDAMGQAAVRIALAEFGPPPEGIPNPRFTAPPPNPIVPSPPPLRAGGWPVMHLDPIIPGTFNPPPAPVPSRTPSSTVPRWS